MAAEGNSCPDVFRPDGPVPWLVFSPTSTFVYDGVVWESVMKHSGQTVNKDNGMKTKGQEGWENGVSETAGASEAQPGAPVPEGGD